MLNLLSNYPNRKKGSKNDKSNRKRKKFFRALHEENEAFIIPNPWEIGTAKILAHLGFQALATTSADYVFSVGKK